MLKILELTKRYVGGFELGPISVEVPTGATVAVFGQNGAGKSTLFSLVTGNADRSTGHAYWSDQKISPDAVDLKRRMGYLPQESDLPAWVTPFEIVKWCATLHKLPDQVVAKSLETWDATAWAHRPLQACSHGMQKRIGLALATMHDPELLILDEAFNALDILHTRTLETMIRSRSDRKQTTLISTHTPWIAATLCEIAWILDGGKLRILQDWTASSVESRVRMIEHEFFKGRHST
jgi:ABC-2 type transport system ATP-binding protein